MRVKLIRPRVLIHSETKFPLLIRKAHLKMVLR